MLGIAVNPSHFNLDGGRWAVWINSTEVVCTRSCPFSRTVMCNPSRITFRSHTILFVMLDSASMIHRARSSHNFIVTLALSGSSEELDEEDLKSSYMRGFISSVRAKIIMG